MDVKEEGYGIIGTTTLGVAEAVERVKATLMEEGFGTLWEIDLQATLKGKMGVDVPPYVILGTCNPQLALDALRKEPNVGLLMPCNVVVCEREGKTVVMAIEPHKQLAVAANPAMDGLADDARGRLERGIAKLP
jgi:uncharacterized protein (DUF302 family)